MTRSHFPHHPTHKTHYHWRAVLPKSDQAASPQRAGFLGQNFRQPTFLGYLALIRIFIGVHFLIVGWPKVLGMSGQTLAAQLSRTAARDPLPFHRDFIVGFVVPHADAFNYLVAYGEVAIGVSLVVGCLVRISSAFGAFHNLNILLAMALPVGGAQVGINLYFIASELAFLFSAAGRSFGLDGLLKKVFPRSSLF